MKEVNQKRLGEFGEYVVAQYLSAVKNYQIITRNYRCRFGEIDIIALRNGCLYFIEVKTRQGYDYGRPCESVTYEKKEHIRKTAAYYLKELKAQGIYIPRVSFQVVELVIEQIEDAF